MEQSENTQSPQRGMDGQQTYNVVADTVTGVNFRGKDNLIQAGAIVVCVFLGAIIAILAFETDLSLTDPNRLALGLVGGFIGLIAGAILSGIGLMIYRFVMHVSGKHD